jgi:2',3'-cyclic-nucleotide 2'-phosphodiesterase/3'-nucleotidase
VNYKVNVAAEPGKRIEDLTLPDGTPVADDDVFVVATNNYRATTNLLVPGAVFEESDMPELVEADIAGSIGGIRDLIIDYIANVCGGTIQPTVSPSWSIVGNDWDPQMHQKAVELVAEGKLSVENIEDGKRLPPTVITEDDVRKQLA